MSFGTRLYFEQGMLASVHGKELLYRERTQRKIHFVGGVMLWPAECTSFGLPVLDRNGAIDRTLHGAMVLKVAIG